MGGLATPALVAAVSNYEGVRMVNFFGAIRRDSFRGFMTAVA
jgi:hypothetical protein